MVSVRVAHTSTVPSTTSSSTDIVGGTHTIKEKAIKSIFTMQEFQVKGHLSVPPKTCPAIRNTSFTGFHLKTLSEVSDLSIE